MSRILDYVLEPSVVYTNGSFLVKVKVQDDYKYKKLLVSENMKYTTATGTTYTLTNAVSTNNASILQLQGNTTQNGTPTPTNPIPIYTVSGDNEVVVGNKNLFNGLFRQGSRYRSGLTTSTRIFSKQILEIKANETYTVSTNLDTNIYKYAINLSIHEFPIINEAILWDSGWKTDSSVTFTPIQNCYIGIVVAKINDTDSLTPSDINNIHWQIEEGPNATEYKPHNKTNYAITLGHNLPSEYQEVEYIEATGTQYINTGINPKMSITRIVCDMSPMATADTAFFGSRGTFYCFYNVGSNYFWPVSKCEYIEGTLQTGNKYHLDWDKGLFKLTGEDGVYELGNKWNETQDVRPLYIFTFNPVDSRYAKAKLYNFQYYYNDKLVRDYIPCYRKSDNEIGLYDKVSNTFFANAGTGTFLKGEDINSANITLNKIGNYVDKLKRAEGKQLFDKDNMNKLNAYFESNNVITASNYNRIFYIECEPNTTYTITQNPSTSPISNHLLQVATSSVLPEIGVECTSNHNIGGDTSYTMTTNADAKYLVFRIRSGDDIDSYLSTIMINYGSTALPYEPYGNNWYVEKNINKVNMEDYNWNKYATNITGISRFATTGIPNVKYVSNNRQLGDCLATCYQNHTGNGLSNAQYCVAIDVSMVQATDNSEDNGVPRTKPRGELYYALKTPEYEIITNENLIEQLNAIQNIELIENLCYVDWVGEEKPTMTLQYPTNETLNAYITTEDNKLIRTDWGV